MKMIDSSSNVTDQSPGLEKSLVLSIDFGTQSVRAMAYRQDGHCVGKSQLPITDYQHPEPGWSEHDVEGLWELLSVVCRQLWEQGTQANLVNAVVVTTQRATVINLDKFCQPLRPAIIWTDQRRSSRRGKLPWYWSAIFSLLRVKRIVESFEGEAEANWLESNQPNIMACTAHLLLLSGYLNYRLTGNLVDSVGSQVGYIPFDFKKQDWCAPYDWKWHSLAIKRSMLPMLRPVGSQLGQITLEAATETGLPPGTPVIAGAADKACEVLGVGALESTTASISCGTIATINTTRRNYVEVIPFMPAYPSAVSGHFNNEIQVFRGYWMVSWFIEQFGSNEVERANQAGVSPETILDELLRDSVPGADGLVLQPFWDPVLGETGPEGRGSIVGFNSSHTRADFYRALLEGVAFALRAGKERIERRTGSPITRLRVSGGGAQSDQILKILADVINLPVEWFDDFEASGRGAAIIGAASLGWYSGIEEAAGKMLGPIRRILPDPANRKCYDDLYRNTYSRLYARLRPLFLDQLRSS